MRNALSIIAVLLITLLPSCKYFKNFGLFGRKADTLAVWQARQDSLRVVDSLRKAQEQLAAIENARLDSARRAEEERLAWESKYRYNIIVGSFITPEYARGLAEDYNKRGYDTRILKMTGSRFELVSAEAHDNFRKAVARLKEYQDTTEIDAWLYIKK